MRQERAKIELTVAQTARILFPYISHQLKEHILTVAPVCLYLFVFQFWILQHSFVQTSVIITGISVVILGLFFFLEGLRISLTPMGEAIGDALPREASISTILLFAFLLGALAAYGEPVIASLSLAAQHLDGKQEPLLYFFLVSHPEILTILLGLGVGCAVLIGTLRFLYNWPLKPLMVSLVSLALLLTWASSQQPALASLVGLAWDCGAVMVGPVLCPLVLALGLGVCRARGSIQQGLEGFGTVAIISIFPVLTLLIAGWVMVHGNLLASFPLTPLHHATSTSWWDFFFQGLRAIAPIFLFLFLFMTFVLKEHTIPSAQLLLGVAFALVGLFLFNLGLDCGVLEMGKQLGDRLPLAFHPPAAALFSVGWGKCVVIIFASLLGYGATLAEPAFNILGQQVEEETQGAFKKWAFAQAVALGVGLGAGLGITSLLFGFSLYTLLIPPYLLALLLTLVSDEKYLNIAWDGGAVTTGPITVPVKMSIGLTLSHATGFAEGFGILALASIYPVLNILLLGLYIRYQEKKWEDPA